MVELPRPPRQLEEPSRRYRFTLDLEADTLHEIGVVLRGLDYLLATGSVQVGSNRTSGGMESGYRLTLTEPHPGRTHEEYVALLDAWVAERRRLRAIANNAI